MTEFAFVLGNGISRKSINPNRIYRFGKTYACNRVYEDFTPDVLVAVDKPISTEIQRSGYSLNNRFYTRTNNIISGSGALPIPKNNGFSSGPVAATIAALDNFPYIFLIGMDLKGNNGYFNNIYADKTFYKSSTDAETYYGNWINQITQIIVEFYNQRFIHVNPLDNYTPQEWRNQRNCSVMNLDEFYTMINNT